VTRWHWWRRRPRAPGVEDDYLDRAALLGELGTLISRMRGQCHRTTLLMTTPIQLRGGYTATDERLGRLPELDDRSRKWPVRSVLDMTRPLRSKTWTLKYRVDQRSTSACTFFSRAMDLAALPVVCARPDGERFDYEYCVAGYKLAQLYDEWEGVDYEGSSALGALKAAQKLGYVGEYRWAFSERDLHLALGYLGPVVLATDWLHSMFRPKPTGLLTVDPQSGFAGGHAYLANAIHVTRTAKRRWLGPDEHIRDEPLLTGPNSWDDAWGKRGYWAMWASDVQLLRKGVRYPGEASVVTKALRRR